MGDKPLIVVFGESVFMDGVAVSLADCRQLTIVHLDSSMIKIRQQIDSLNPDVILYELQSSESPQILSFLKERPGVLLVALDLDCNRAIVLRSRQQFTRTMHDLYQIVEAEVGDQLQFTVEGELAKSLTKNRPATPASTR